MHLQSGGYSSARKNNCHVEFAPFLDIAAYCSDSPSLLKLAKHVTDSRNLVTSVSRKKRKIPITSIINQNDGSSSGETPSLASTANISAFSQEDSGDDQHDYVVVDSSKSPLPEATTDTKEDNIVINKSAINKSVPKAFHPYPYRYRLCAIVAHHGSHDAGHFITYRRVSRAVARAVATAAAGGLRGVEGVEGYRVVEHGLPFEVLDALIAERPNEKWVMDDKSSSVNDDNGERWFRISDAQVEWIKGGVEEVVESVGGAAY
ncbi:hypothetical protein HK096_004629, partial [Nowakowskiella sp. JEL0078]